MADWHSQSAPSIGSRKKQWPNIIIMQDRKLEGDNWGPTQAINNKRKFDLKKSIDFANLPWLKGLTNTKIYLQIHLN